MSSGSQPTPPSPTQSAQAEASAQLAGQMFQAENAPVLGYENALTSGLLQPYANSVVNATSANSAMDQAQASQAIQAETNPQAYEEQQMRLQGTNARLGALYGVNPSSYGYSAPAAFQYPSLNQLPSLGSVGLASRQIASNLGSVSIGNGGQVGLIQPGNPQPLNVDFRR